MKLPIMQLILISKGDAFLNGKYVNNLKFEISHFSSMMVEMEEGGDADSWELFGLLPTLQEKQQLPEI